MKTTLLTLLFAGALLFANSQDIITTIEGEKINCLITKRTDYATYFKTSDGFNSMLAQRAIKSIEINVVPSLGWPKLDSTMTAYGHFNKAASEMKKFTGLMTGGTALLGASIISLTLSAMADNPGGLEIVSIGTGVIGTILLLSAPGKIRKAGIELEQAGAGLRLRYRFN